MGETTPQDMGIRHSPTLLDLHPYYFKEITSMICDMCAKENKCNTAVLKNGLRVNLCNKCNNELKEMKHILTKDKEENK